MTFAHETRVNASAETVWGVLQDLPGWHAWNPIYPQASGVAAAGSLIALTIALPGAKPQRMNARVLVAEPNRRLAFEGKAVGGLVKATRSFELVALSPTTCLLKGEEVFAGLLGPVMAALVGSKVRQAVGQVNEALKRASEQAAAAG